MALRRRGLAGGPAGARVRSGEDLQAASIDLPTTIMEIQVKRRIERGALAGVFRSYAGMTRIRFKGPAHRHLSTVTVPPSEWVGN